MHPGSAAEIEHIQIDLEHIDKIYKHLSKPHDILFVEGAGSVILNDTDGKADAAGRANPEVLARYLDVPVLGILLRMKRTETIDPKSSFRHSRE